MWRRPSTARGRRVVGPRRTRLADDGGPCGLRDRSVGSSREFRCERLNSEQPREELTGKQCEATAEDDSRNLPLGPLLGEHEEEPTDDDGHKGERARERTGEGELEIEGGALPRRLCERSMWKRDEHEREEDQAASTDER